jgi:transcriptional regulator with XRE-family HTH domain
MTGHVKTENLTGQHLAQVARFRLMAERHLLYLGAAIKDAREAKGLSRSQLGREVHVEEKTIERWEKGKSGGAHDSLGAVARALGTTADALLAAAAAKGREENGAAEKPAPGQPDPKQMTRIEEHLEELATGQSELVAKLDEFLAALGRERRPREGDG